jgi:hypothetical protein
MRQWKEANPEKYRLSKVPSMYGISVEQYLALKQQQGDLCAICGNAPRGALGLHVDHCHKTGKVRGLLCHHCNTAIGLLGERVDRMRAAIAYLEMHDGQS